MTTVRLLIVVLSLMIFMGLFSVLGPHGYRTVQKTDGSYCEQELAWPNWEDLYCSTVKSEVTDATKKDEQPYEPNKVAKVITSE